MVRFVNNRDKHSLPSPLPANPLRDDALLLERVRAVLAPMPEVHGHAIANILRAVAERRPSRLERWRGQVEFAFEQFRFAASPRTSVAAVAVLCAAAGFVARGVLMDNAQRDLQGLTAVATGKPAMTSSTVAPTVPVQMVGDAANRTLALIPVQFVLDARQTANATSVTVVGDFNDWSVTASPMRRDGSVWSLTLPAAPGRHVYAFVIDGERWIADPRAPRASDTDFGRPGSVIIVQSP